ncbi:MAG TPA: hypothetical protein VKR06_16410 [Ktedonosporobacter sp.]|nr:hypothetical protein [Ktedonosporobacter sp.]
MLKKQSIIQASRACIVLLVSITLFNGCSLWPANVGQAQEAKKPTLYPATQGLYESCSPFDGDICLNHLKTIAAAGFTLVVNYNQLYGTEAQELAYAKEAHSLGIQIIWDMSEPIFWNGNDVRAEYKDLAATCSCSDNSAFIAYVINLVKRLPATWGYYIGDEAPAENHDSLKAFADAVRQLDPGHPRLYIAGENASTMGANVKPFVDSAEVVGGDIYPVSTSDPITSVGEISHAIQAILDQHGNQSAIVLQAFNWGEYPKDSWVCSKFPACAHFPTREEMSLMRNLVIKNAHPQFILWYSYFDINRSDDPAGHMEDLIKAASSPVI